MITKVTLPKLGETVEVSKIERWRKNEGDKLEVGDVLCEITTDKATLEVENYRRGTLLKILQPAGRELAVGTLIAIIGDPGEKIPDDLLAGAAAAPAKAPAKATAGAPAPVAASAPAGTRTPVVAAAPAAPAAAVAAVTASGRIIASPRAKRLAAELGVALATVRGTGSGGRIVEADVEAAAKAAPSVLASPLARKIAAAKGVDVAQVAGSGPRGKVMKEDVRRAAEAPAAAAPVYPAAGHGVPGEIVPLTPMRRIVAERMLESKRTIPCYYLEMDFDVTDLVCLRNKLNARDPGAKVTFNDFVIKACAMALKAFPIVNSRWVQAGVERRREVNVGFAVALDEGLVVPVVRAADTKPLRQLSQESADLIARARTKKLLPEEYQGGCLTVTNLGMFGIRSFIPVVNLGESTILGLGVVQDRVVFRQGGIQIRKMMAATLAVDHRVIDGAVGAQFLEMIRDGMEAPQKLVE